jgi:type I restriction enzyme S subunit
VSYDLVEFGTVCKFVRGPFGGSLKKNMFVEDGYAVYEQQHAIYDQFSEIRYFIDESKFKEMSRFELLPNDLIMSCSGTMGKVAVVPNNIKRGIINQALLKLTPGPNIDRAYLKWLITSSYFKEKLNGLSGGAAIQNVASVSLLKQIKIPLPPMALQKIMVEKLDAIFAEIDKAIAATEANIKNAEALFQSYLSNVLNECKRKYTSVSLSTVCEFDKRQGMHKNLPYVGLEHIESCTAKFLGNFDVTQVSSTTFYFNEEHVLYGRLRPYLNKVLLPDFQGHCSTEIFPLKVKNGLTRNYFKFWLMSASVNYLINKTSTGARMPRANMNEVLTFEFNLPPVDVQNQLVDELNFMNSKCESLKISYSLKKQQLNCLKIAMLNEVFNGSPLEV